MFGNDDFEVKIIDKSKIYSFYYRKKCTFAVSLFVSVAQLVEQLTLNQWVGGSSPPGDTIKQNACIKLCRHFYFVKKHYFFQNMKKHNFTLFIFPNELVLLIKLLFIKELENMMKYSL